jgi:hypothetical protein
MKIAEVLRGAGVVNVIISKQGDLKLEKTLDNC